MRAVRFIRRDPRAVTIGIVRLDEHLGAMKIEAPLVVARMLTAQDWVPFEARYSPDGRPGYHPEPTMGLVLSGIMKGIECLRGLEELARCGSPAASVPIAP